jgi:hypothetical protein
VAVEIGPGVVPFLAQRADLRYGVRDVQGVVEEQVGSALATAWVTNGHRSVTRLVLTQEGERVAAAFV